MYVQSPKSPDSHRPQEYDFRRDINVLSHPRYSKAVRKIVMESPHEDHNVCMCTGCDLFM